MKKIITNMPSQKIRTTSYSRAKIFGLQKTPNLNGKIGDRMAPVHGKPGRWKVIINGKKYSIHEKNLKDTSTLFRIQVFLSNMFVEIKHYEEKSSKKTPYRLQVHCDIQKLRKKFGYALISEKTCDALDKIMSNIIKEEGSIAVENLFCGKKPIESMLLEIIRNENPQFTIHASDKEPLNDEFKKFQINHTQIDYTKENPFADYDNTSKVVLFMSYPDFPQTHVSKGILKQFMEKGGKHVITIYEPISGMNLSEETESIINKHFIAIEETGVPLEIMHSVGIRDWLTHFKRKP